MEISCIYQKRRQEQDPRGREENPSNVFKRDAHDVMCRSAMCLHKHIPNRGRIYVNVTVNISGKSVTRLLAAALS